MGTLDIEGYIECLLLVPSMSMPFNTKLAPIEVFEDDKHFLIRIHAGNRDRAKKIIGRQWDGDRKAWVYPKDLPTYEALVKEFRTDADSFDIRRPKTERPPDSKPPAREVDDDESEDQLSEEIPSSSNIGESQGNINNELEQIRVMLESLRDVTANQSHRLEEMRGVQQEATMALAKLKLPTQQTVKTEKVETLPELLNLSKQKEVELLEKALIDVACFAVKAEEQKSTVSYKKSFRNWVTNYRPLSNPTDFVIETHEFLRKQLAKIVEDDACTDFHYLVQKAKDENLIFKGHDPTIKAIPILFTLNTIRNRFAHSPIDDIQWQGEKWSRSILYLTNLALVWSKVVIEAEDCHE